MTQSRPLIVALFLIAVLTLSMGIWRAGYLQATGQLAQQGEADLTLATDRLAAQLQRYQETAVLLVDHPALDHLYDLAGQQAAQALLLEVADKTSALELLYVDRSGHVLVDARGTGPANLADRSFFIRALQGALGSAHSADPIRTYSYAAPDFAADGQVQGALVVVVDIDTIEGDWRGSTPVVFFTDDLGDVFISNRPELVAGYGDTSDGHIATPPPLRTRDLDGHQVWDLDWGPYVPGHALHLARDLPAIGLTGEVLIDLAPARRIAFFQAAAVAALCLAFGALLFLVTERRRALAQANAVLETNVANRTRALQAANSQLRREIIERHEAEAALKQAQADLVQAGKLSALGQMSAGISHELNQPLMAIRQFADNGAAFLDRDKPQVARDNLTRIADLAARAARIIKNLRAFARNESEPMDKVDLVQVVTTAIELTDPRLRSAGVTLDWRAPDQPVLAWGGEVRLVQVLVNLINNATDAMADQPDKRLTIALSVQDPLTLTLCDTGPGIAEPDKIFEPFYSTKPVGGDEGMGLGLSISYGLVQSFGGRIRGSNTGTGAMFTIELEPYETEQAA